MANLLWLDSFQLHYDSPEKKNVRKIEEIFSQINCASTCSQQESVFPALQRPVQERLNTKRE